MVTDCPALAVMSSGCLITIALPSIEKQKETNDGLIQSAILLSITKPTASQALGLNASPLALWMVLEDSGLGKSMC